MVFFMQKNDYLKTGLSPIMARKLLTDIFQIDKSYLPSLVILINTIKLKDETIKSADFNIICTSLEWVMERTQHLTILELYTAIFLVLDSEYQGIVNVDKIHGFITGLIKDPSIDITSPNFQLVEFLHCAQQVSDNQLPITQFMRHISVPVLQINELQPLPYNQTHSFKQLQTTTKQQKDVDLDQLFKDFEIDSQLCSRIKQYVLGNEHEKFIKNKIVGIFNNNIHEYGKIEGIIRSLYSVLEQNGIDTEMLILTSRIFNTPIDMETAQLVIRGYVEDSSERLLMNDFVHSPRATDSQSTLETKQVLRTVSMYRVLQQNNKVTVLAIHSFLEKQYGIFKGEMNFEEFKLFMKAYERCLDYSTLSLALTVKCICNGIWNNKQFKQIPKLFHVSEDVLEKFKQHCHTKTVAATPEEFSTFLMPYVQVQLF
ncbi:EF-hand domain-containing protein [Entamoeba marina]